MSPLERKAVLVPEVTAGRPLHVLVVEDDLDARSNFTDLLELDGHSVRTAASASEVLAHPDLAAFEAVLLDWTLPDGNAGMLLPDVRRRAPEADVFIITGRGDLGSAVTALREGAADYLLKPIDPDALRTALARVTAARQAREDQQKRLAAVGQMVSVVSHESKNELAVIHMATELLEELLMGKGPVEALRAETSEAVKLIRQAEGNLLRLLEDVRGYAAPVVLDRRPCDLRRIWRAAWERTAAKHEGPGAILNDGPADSPLVAPVDGFRVGQIFRNLFENSLTAKEGPVRVEVSCREGAGALEISVRDDGPGLSAEQRRRLFEPFYTTKATGTGLGMAVVRRIIEAHGGAIEARDGGAGAEFVITLPR